MATIVGPLLNPDRVSVSRRDRDAFLTMLDLQPFGVPLRLGHCDCDGCHVGEIVDVMNTGDGRTWAVALTDLPRERCAGQCFSLGGIVVDDEPAERVTPRLTVLREVSLVERSGSATAPVRWQPTTLEPWNRGGYVHGTTAAERQVLDQAVSRLDFQRRAGVIEVITLADPRPASITPIARKRRADADFEPVDPFGPQPQRVTRDKHGSEWHSRYFADAGWKMR